jgi:hypothetical protein
VPRRNFLMTINFIVIHKLIFFVPMVGGLLNTGKITYQIKLNQRVDTLMNMAFFALCTHIAISLTF